MEMEAGHIIQGDPFLIRQAINNVLDNAIDFSPMGGCITITGKAEPNGYLLSIRDEGAGIPDYAAEKIFDRFYSLPRPDSGKKSTGLGLAFVREVMLLHRGEVRVIASSGCEMGLWFPR